MTEDSIGTGFVRLNEVIAQLREYCPWMGSLTHAGLVEYLIEETYELVEAVEQDHSAEEFAGELGDVLLQVVLHARLAAESGRFDIGDVVAGLTDKMVRRNAHVFTPDGGLRESFDANVDEIVERWQHVKQQEKPERTSVFDGIPASLPALALATKSLKRAGAADGGQAADEGETDGPAAAGTTTSAPTSEHELGDLLLDVVRHATADGLDAERALRSAVVRFQKSHDS